jgi:hypothetical protein
MTIKEQIMAMPVSQVLGMRIKYKGYTGRKRVGKIDQIREDDLMIWNPAYSDIVRYEDILEKLP